MAIRKIVTLGDDVLRKTSRPVVKFDEKLWQLLDDMKETMEKADGVGLAAVQVGVLRRAIVIDVGDGLIELINPEIIETSGEQEGQEGELINISVVVSTRDEAELIKKNFESRPGSIYRGVLFSLTGKLEFFS